MSGRGISIGKLGPQSCAAGKTLKKCSNKAGKENVVIIDLDSNSCNNVILVDVPEFLPKRLRGSSSNGGLTKDDEYSFATVVCVDDEDDDTDDEDNDLDEVQIVQENRFPVKLSKCKQTYSGKAFASNCYGFDTDSKSDSGEDEGDDDYSDFEFEDYSGKLKEQWEKAFLRRQNEIFARDDRDGSSMFCSDNPQDIDTVKKSDRSNDDSDSPSLSSLEEVDRSPAVANDTGNSEGTFKMNNDTHSGPLFGMRDHTSASRFCAESSQDVGMGYMTNDNSSMEKEHAICNSEACPVDVGNDSLFFNREMHKETDEYKRSVEEELASRQRELQIQAEEAKQLKRLQKRKKAERMRLLDMETRQKQRVEAMRETQKKDEENLYLKEKLRAEVQKDLRILETTCSDMASILRGLGIQISSNSGANEVRVAFKKALLRFHPDRASQSDMRQQVEAEEKFKLISRMKEKFLLTS